MKEFYKPSLRLPVFVICVVVSALAAAELLAAASHMKVYSFETSYTQCSEIADGPAMAGAELIRAITEKDEGETEFRVSPDIEYYAENLKTKRVLANTEHRDREYFTAPEGACYVAERRGGVFSEHGGAAIMREYGGDGADDFIVCVRFKESALTEIKTQWENEREICRRAFSRVPIYAALLLIGLIYLSLAAFRGGNRVCLTDRIPIEPLLVAGALIALSAFAAFAALSWVNGADSLVKRCGGIIGGAAAAGLLEIYLSVIRSLGGGGLQRRCLILRLARLVLKKTRSAARGLIRAVRKAAASSRASKLVLASFSAYSALIALFAAFAGARAHSGGAGCAAFPIIAALLFAAALYALYREITDAGAVRDGLRRIREGDAAHKITGCRSPFAASAAEEINAIGDGIQNAVEKSIRAEHMKTELITNVSHDLKTPLTSIINYTELLMRENLSPEKANDYVKIIDTKGRQLKRLTSDLFDISKARSGSEEPDWETLDYKLLIAQIAAELDSEIKAARLELVMNMPEEETETVSDGKKLSRIYENLLGNAAKYSLPGTRVYIDLYRRGGSLVAEIKNIAGYKMEFDGGEIVERFARGDKSRADGGSGLGLAIAKSYAELLGGTLEIRTDGDLFKAVVAIPAK